MSLTIHTFDLRKCFKTERKFLLVVGLYPFNGTNFKQLNFLSCCFTVTIAIAMFLSMMIQLLIYITDLLRVSETLFFSITHITYMCKMLNFIYYKKAMARLEDSLTDEKFYGHSKHGLTILKAKLKFNKMVNASFQLMCVIAVLMQGGLPYLDGTKSGSLPLSTWFPYDTTKYYWPSVILQIVALLYTAVNNVCLDTLTWTLLTLPSAQFDILKVNLQNIDFGNGGSEEFQSCVEHHKTIIRLVNQIEATFSKGIFINIFASAVAICFTGFMIMLVQLVPLFSMDFCFLTAYLLCMVTEVAAYCWFGHDVMITSDEIGNSLYMSNWYLTDIPLRKSLLIFLERVKKPVNLTAGKLIVLSLPTFTSILQSSYSYFAVLQRLYGDS